MAIGYVETCAKTPHVYHNNNRYHKALSYLPTATQR